MKIKDLKPGQRFRFVDDYQVRVFAGVSPCGKKSSYWYSFGDDWNCFETTADIEVCVDMCGNETSEGDSA